MGHFARERAGVVMDLVVLRFELLGSSENRALFPTGKTQGGRRRKMTGAPEASPGVIVQQDNARPHAAGEVNGKLQDLNRDSLPHPPSMLRGHGAFRLPSVPISKKTFSAERDSVV